MMGLRLVLGMNIRNSFEFKNDFVIDDEICFIFSNEDVFIGDSEFFVLFKWDAL